MAGRPHAQDEGREPAGHPVAAVEEILSDGVVTDEEYETAVFRMYDCVRESGAAVSEPQRSADGQLGFFFEADDLETSPVDARHQECEALHYRAVATAWVLQR
ncbi:MAG: hypothetical protein ACE5GB_08640, partial [Acidimicrobiales bacterium]